MDKNNTYSIGFYNLENLFDTIDDPNILDDDFTEEGKLEWDEDRYQNKIYKLGRAISEIGTNEAGEPPVLVGVAEVENKKVLNDLTGSSILRPFSYEYVHYNSPDERGIDTALLYQKEHLEVLNEEIVPLLVDSEEGERDYTRDILHVTGNLHGERIHILVNHWPSRRHGADETSYKRVKAAKLIHSIIERVKEEEASPKFIIMGDFNDDPQSESIKTLVNEAKLKLYNPMEKLHIPDERGSLSYHSKWNLFDQIIISANFFDVTVSKHTFIRADILDERFLEEWNKKYEGEPFRTYVGRKYLGGYSDHFPVFIHLKKK
ncbi:endonuclease [Galbibacter sp. EGI 63066]|uniref:endonuclease/exonuclease/phosphatase family protein n=1 Tax=Galbibacter sp. EGI 63066 TaxID=2993559 RepID=UPI0022496BDA|nr:endonuclease [Galbibacter sp. EGI 63066]MCX2681244.1 endonuclease [Galbibacter sp. EGI 63066]